MRTTVIAGQATRLTPVPAAPPYLTSMRWNIKAPGAVLRLVLPVPESSTADQFTVNTYVPGTDTASLSDITLR